MTSKRKIVHVILSAKDHAELTKTAKNAGMTLGRYLCVCAVFKHGSKKIRNKTIYSAFQGGTKKSTLAKMYGLTPSRVSDIVVREHREHQRIKRTGLYAPPVVRECSSPGWGDAWWEGWHTTMENPGAENPYPIGLRGKHAGWDDGHRAALGNIRENTPHLIQEPHYEQIGD